LKFTEEQKRAKRMAYMEDYSERRREVARIAINKEISMDDANQIWTEQRQREVAQIEKSQGISNTAAHKVWLAQRKKARLAAGAAVAAATPMGEWVHGGITVGEMMAGLQKLSYIVVESGAASAEFTWADGSRVLVDSNGAIQCKPPVVS
jgi:hypothetical protein